MNQLIRGRYSTISFQLIRSQFIGNSLIVYKDFKHISRQLDCNQVVGRRHFITVENIVMICKITPIICMFLGFAIQDRWPQLRDKSIKKLISNNKLRGVSVIGLFGLCFSYFVDNYSEETPFTKRKRILLFSEEKFQPISEMMFKIAIKDYKNRILPPEHRTTKRVTKIIDRLLVSNEKELTNKDWTVYIIKEPGLANAFVLPNGQIFIYTGMIDNCDNDHQLATILAHEMSHTVMFHGKELCSQDVIFDLIQSFWTLLFWIRFHPLKALLCTVLTKIALKYGLYLPNRRLIELESDFVGLLMAGKACYDVREGSAFWMKMEANRDRKILSSLSTHPSNKTRYELMDSYMKTMIKIVESNGCPKLPEKDPRDLIRTKLSHSERWALPKKE